MTATARQLPDLGLVDHDFVAQLIDAVGVDEYCALVESLTRDVATQVAALDVPGAGQDPAAAKQAAHRLAGLMSQFGAFEVARIAERMIETESRDEISKMAENMTRLCRASMAAIASIKAV